MPNTQPPTSDYETKLDTILDAHFEHGAFNPATNGEKFKVYQKSYRDEAKQALMSLLNTELYKAREDELNQIPHKLLHIPEVHEYKSRRLASLKDNI